MADKDPDFDNDIALEPLGNGHYRATITRSWWIIAGPNGGLLIAQLANAMRHELADPVRQLRTITVHYLRPPTEGTVDIAVDLIRVGRSVASVRATMSQGDKPIATALAAYSPAWDVAHTFSNQAMPAVAAVSGLTKPEPGEFEPPLRANYDMYPLTPMTHDAPQALYRSWIRTRKPRRIDELALVAFADALPPPIFMMLDEPMAVPTIELTVHIRATLPHQGLEPDHHLLMEATSNHLADGFIEEDTRIWAPDGTLLAQSRQLALAR